MNIYDLEKQVTPTPWVVSKEGDAYLLGDVFVAGNISVGSCLEHANARLVVHFRNHFMEALECLKEQHRSHTDPELCPVCKLIAKLEEVK